MQEKTALGISDTFREYIEALVEEVVINGESFDAQKKWLRKNSEAEGLSYETVESNLNDLFEAIKELEEHESKTTERFVRSLAQSCNCSKTEVDKFIDYASAVRAQKEAEKKAQEERAQQAQEDAERIEKERLAAERKAKREAQKKAREKAEREAKEAAERKAREERERKAKEEDERKAKEEAESIALQERERKAKEEAERKKGEEAEQRAREEAQLKEKEEAEEKAKKEEAEQKRRLLVEENKEPVKVMTAALVIVSLLEIVILKWWCILPLIVNAFLGILTQQNCKEGDFHYKKLVLWGGILVLACFFEAFLRWWSLLLIPITGIILVFLPEIIDDL